MTSKDITQSLNLVWTERLPDMPPPMAQEVAAIDAAAQDLKTQYEAIQARAVTLIGQIYNTWSLSQINTAQQYAP